MLRLLGLGLLLGLALLLLGRGLPGPGAGPWGGVALPVAGLGGRPGSDPPGQEAYTVVIDAGSTGSRVHIFRFEKLDGGFKLVSDAFHQLKPGLSAFAGNPTAAAGSLGPLLARAVEAVPAALRAETQLELRATAGLRLLPGGQAEEILGGVRERFARTPFLSRRDSVSILDGSDEGAYMWLTMNYLLGNLEKGYAGTVGSIDLGGGSVQQAYAISDAAAAEAPPGYVQKLRAGDQAYNVYVHSYLGHGLMAGRAGALDSARLGAGQEWAESACMPSGYDKAYVYAGKEHVAVGADAPGGAEHCAADVRLSLLKEKPCEVKFQCSFGGAWSGGGGEGARAMYLTSYFFDRAVEAGLAPSSATSARLRPAEFRAKADAVCRLPWKGLSDMQARFPDVEADHAPFMCMDLSFIASLLVDGFKIAPEAELVVVKQFLYNGLLFESAWPLGAAINTLSG